MREGYSCRQVPRGLLGVVVPPGPPRVALPGRAGARGPGPGRGGRGPAATARAAPEGR